MEKITLETLTKVDKKLDAGLDTWVKAWKSKNPIKELTRKNAKP